MIIEYLHKPDKSSPNDQMSVFPHGFIFETQTDHEEQDNQGGLMFIRRSVSCSQVNHGFGEEDMGLKNREAELSDECGGKKKKRLKREQVKELERSFELRNKLDPEKKLQLAKSLGLQPRQIAIWFQNRRARWKGKQLEKEYCLLKKQFDSAMADNEKLQSQNKKLLHEALKRRDMILKGTTSNKKEVPNRWSSWSNSANKNSFEKDLFDPSRTLSSMNLFPSPFSRPPTTLNYMHEPSFRPDPQISIIDQVIPDESLCNILCNMDNQTTGLWSWTEQHHFSQ